MLNPAWEAEDGGRRLSTSINFPACSDVSQVAQLMSAYIKDARRFRTHRLVLPPEAFLLEPLDTIAWSSARNGYSAKIFEVVEITDQPGTINQELVLRERDPADYSWSAAQDLPAVVPVTGLTPRPAQVIEGWSAAPASLEDGAGRPRRPAIALSWTGTAAEDARFIRYEIRTAATGQTIAQTIAAGLADRAAGSVLVSEGLLPETAYEVRGRYLLERPTAWSSWLAVTTPARYLSQADFANGVVNLFLDQGLGIIPNGPYFPTAPQQGDLFFLTSDGQLYSYEAATARWILKVQPESLDASQAIAANTITAGLLATSGLITQTAQIADGIITNAKIGDTIQSSNYLAGSTGWQIRKDGSANFNGPVISRQLQVAEGVQSVPNNTIQAGNTATLQKVNEVFIETTVDTSAWFLQRETFMASVVTDNLPGGGSLFFDSTAFNTQPQNILWGWEAHVLPINRWSGADRLWIKAEFYARYVIRLENFQLKWRLYKVT